MIPQCVWPHQQDMWAKKSKHLNPERQAVKREQFRLLEEALPSIHEYYSASFKELETGSRVC